MASIRSQGMVDGIEMLLLCRDHLLRSPFDTGAFVVRRQGGGGVTCSKGEVQLLGEALVTTRSPAVGDVPLTESDLQVARHRSQSGEGDSKTGRGLRY